MLRVEFDQREDGALGVRLQGRLVGAYAEDARATLSRFPMPKSIAVDLSEVSFVDAFGEQVLLWLARLGECSQLIHARYLRTPTTALCSSAIRLR